MSLMFESTKPQTIKLVWKNKQQKKNKNGKDDGRFSFGSLEVIKISLCRKKNPVTGQHKNTNMFVFNEL